MVKSPPPSRAEDGRAPGAATPWPPPHPAGSKRTRQNALLEALSREELRTQEDIVSALARRGVRATQVSISRDVEELGLLKVAGRYQAAPAGTGHSDPELPLRTWVRGASAAGPHLVVIRCDAGTAQGVARALDYAGIEGLVGTVAGDDTVFAAMDSARSGAALLSGIRKRAALTPVT